MRADRFSWLCLFIVSFGLYLSSIAPTVTFEDSGELIAAAWQLGVPHQPGYPLFTLLGRLFSMLPLSNIAFQLNLMSAFFTSLAVVCCAITIRLHVGNAYPELVAQLGPAWTAIVTTAPALGVAVAFEVWEQAIITEVYGIHIFFTAVFVLIAYCWSQFTDEKQHFRCYILMCYLAGLALTNHTTSLLMIPVGGILIIVTQRDWFLSLRNLLSGAVAYLIGLLPLVYLPLASRRNPWMDWGNPETLTNFLRTISRHQYGLGEGQSIASFFSQFLTYFSLLTDQWFIILPLMALLGLYCQWRTSKKLFWFSLVFLVFTIPITTFMTNFDVSSQDRFLNAEHRALVSVFYIPSYFYLSLLAGIGAVGSILLLRKHGAVRWSLFGVLLFSCVYSGYRNYSDVDMTEYYYAADYCHNIMQEAGSNAVVFTNWDPFYFPLNYMQYVENQRPDVLVLDQQLMRRSWYIQWLRDHYPERMAEVEQEATAFVREVSAFEAKAEYDAVAIERAYQMLIAGLVERAIESGFPVHFTYAPPTAVQQNYWMEPLIATIRLRLHSERSISAARLESLKFRGFDPVTPRDERMATMISKYYSGLALSRARLLIELGHMEAARPFLLHARRLSAGDLQIQTQIQLQQSRIEN